MRKKQIYQATFERGMIESWKQDSFLEQDAVLSSALWIENYLPDIEHKSLVQRYGFTEDNRTHLIIPLLSSYLPNTTSLNEIYPIRHIVGLKSSNPVYSDSIVLFAERTILSTDAILTGTPCQAGLVTQTGNISSTALITNIPEYTTPTGSPTQAMRESWAVPPVAGTGFNGWYVLGSLADSTKYGESVMFSTILRDGTFQTSPMLYFSGNGNRLPMCNFMYPVYQWGRWDLTKKRTNGNQYFNGLTINNLANRSVFSKYKVFQPTMELVRNNVCNTAYVDITTQAIVNPAGTAAGSVEVVFWERPIYKFDKVNAVDHDVSRLFDDNLLIPEYPFLKHQAVEGSINTVSGFKLTYQIPEVPIVTGVTSYRAKLIAAGWSPGNFGMGKYTDSLFTVTPSEFSEVITPDKYIDAACRASYLPDWSDIPHNIKTMRNDMYAPNTCITLHAMLDYVSLKCPRPWHTGEQIPYVLTAVQNGAEIVIHKDIYTVQGTLNNGTTTVPFGYLHGVTVSYDEDALIKCWNSLRSSLGAIGIPKYGIARVVSKSRNDNPTYGKWDWFGFHTTPVRAQSPHIVIHTSSGTDKAVIGNMVMFTIRINSNYLNSIYDKNISEFRLYVSEGSKTRKLVSTYGVSDLFDAPALFYTLPATMEQVDRTNEDYGKYRLVGKYLIDGIGSPSPDNRYPDVPVTLGMNAWLQDAGWNYAVPQDAVGTPRNMTGFNGLLTGMHYNRVTPLTELTDWTPNFVLYDYPISTPLSLDGSGKYWKGIGARLVATIKGRIHISGCIDENGIEEQGVSRFSAVIKGVATKDVFYQEHKLQVGHEPHTAMVEFREQMIWFSRNRIYRVIMPDAYNQTTWEFLDAQEGIGTFNQKTVVSSPYGIIFGNEEGIWVTDGGKPDSLSDNRQHGISIKSLYQFLATGNTYRFAELNNPGQVIIDNLVGYNRFMEFTYDNEKDELVISTPTMRLSDIGMFTPFLPTLPNTSNWLNWNHIIYLIFNFKNRSWRVESRELPVLNTQIASVHWSPIHKVYFIQNRYMEMLDNGFNTGNGIDHNISFISKDPRVVNPYQDNYIYPSTVTMPIKSRLVTHEIGDGINDGILHSILLELIPSNNIYIYNTNNIDPILETELRNRTFKTQTPTHPRGWIDLVAHNWLSKGRASNNPFVSLMQGTVNLDPSDVVSSREGLMLLAPMHTKYRRSRFRLSTIVGVVLKSLHINVMEDIRRRQ